MTEHESNREEPIGNPLFLGLVGNLQVSALIHLGKIAEPTSGETKRSLPAAKATIDLLRMLKEKTDGNLTEGERSLLDHTIFELQLNYVDEIDKKEESENATKKTAVAEEREETVRPPE